MEETVNEFDRYDIDTDFFTLSGLKTFARVVDIYDGDTMTCVVPLFNNHYKFIIRLDGIDTCEIRNKNVELKQKGLLARKMIIDILFPDNHCTVDISKKELQEFLKSNVKVVWLECLDFDKYGRILGKIYKDKQSNKSLSDILLDEKLAYKYEGGTKLSDDKISETIRN